MTTYTLNTYPTPNWDGDDLMDNGPVGEMIRTYEFAYPGEARVASESIRADLHGAGMQTRPGFIVLEAVLAFELVAGGYVALVR
jgi:hypothetical protein